MEDSLQPYTPTKGLGTLRILHPAKSVEFIANPLPQPKVQCSLRTLLIIKMAKVVMLSLAALVAWAADPTQQIQVGLGPSDYVKTGAVEFSDGELEHCELFDSCRTCTFTELQQVDACQKTGFRMILKCTT